MVGQGRSERVSRGGRVAYKRHPFEMETLPRRYRARRGITPHELPSIFQSARGHKLPKSDGPILPGRLTGRVGSVGLRLSGYPPAASSCLHCSLHITARSFSLSLSFVRVTMHTKVFRGASDEKIRDRCGANAHRLIRTPSNLRRVARRDTINDASLTNVTGDDSLRGGDSGRRYIYGIERKMQLRVLIENKV